MRHLMFGLTGVQAGTCVAPLLLSGLLINSLMRLKNDDHGIRADRALTMRLPFGSWFPKPRHSRRSSSKPKGICISWIGFDRLTA